MKNPADIFEYFKHYSRDLEAHGSRHLAVCFGEDIGESQLGIGMGHIFGLLYRYISIGLVVHDKAVPEFKIMAPNANKCCYVLLWTSLLREFYRDVVSSLAI